MATTQEDLSKSRLFRRLRSGTHGHFVELYAEGLCDIGLGRPSTWRSLNVVGNLLMWMASHRTKLSRLDERMVERYLRHHAAKQTIHLDDRAALKRWLSTLRTAGVIAPAPVPTMTPHERIFAEFGDYLRTEVCNGMDAPPAIERSCHSGGVTNHLNREGRHHEDHDSWHRPGQECVPGPRY